MAEFPLEPMLCKMLIMSVHLGCSEEMLTIVSMLSVQNVFYRPKDKQALADQKKAKFHQPEGDHLTLLAVYNSWKNNKFSNPWCYENFIQARSLRRAQDIRKQMLGIMDRCQGWHGDVHERSRAGSKVLSAPQAQAGRGVLWQSNRPGAESHLQRVLQERSQEGPSGGLPHPDRPAGGVHPSLQRSLQPPARVGGLPRAGPDHQGVHARGDHHRPPLAGGVCSGLFQSVRPHSPQQAEETAAPGAALQPLRGAQRLEDLTRLQAPLRSQKVQPRGSGTKGRG
ncbi:unnamed protein product [Tetraodon nigroviridis]|uniref:(spotted green pufferfish) hypothetical protein n=1 Tax=Tetraodon nigroviridis TaxID=99883 RepID=Q4TIZ5_TETNG|nr:unnamed protein product [Tetraodon nigroviridis]